MGNDGNRRAAQNGDDFEREVRRRLNDAGHDSEKQTDKNKSCIKMPCGNTCTLDFFLPDFRIYLECKSTNGGGTMKDKLYYLAHASNASQFRLIVVVGGKNDRDKRAWLHIGNYLVGTEWFPRFIGVKTVPGLLQYLEECRHQFGRKQNRFSFWDD